MRFFKLIWRGIRDVFEQLVFMAGLSIGWWLCAAPAVYGFTLFLSAPILFPVLVLSSFLIPPATMTLFAMSDPRRIVSKPDLAEVWAFFRSSIKRGWLVGLFTVPALLVLIWNIIFFIGSTSWFAAFVPLWGIMVISIFILMLYMYSVAANMEAGPRNAFRGAMYVLISRPFAGLFLSVLIVLGGGLISILVLPMLLFGPAVMSSVVNRFVFEGLDVTVIDPNAPTTERDDERQRGINHDTTIWDRLKTGGRKRH